MNVKNAMIGFILNLLASGVWQYFSDKKVDPIIVGSAIIWVLLLLDSGRKDPTGSFLTKLWQILVPPKTVKFVSNVNYGNESSWNDAKVNGQSAMQVRSKLSATNITDEGVLILGAYLVKPRTKGTRVDVSTRAHDSNMFGEFPILPRCKTEISVHYWICPPIRKEGESFKGKFVFVDQFDNKHKVWVTFEARSRVGELVIATRLRLKFQDDLNSKILPRAIRKKLSKKGESLSHKLIISVKGDGWEVKDPEKPDWIYTARIEDKKLYLYKRYIPPPRQVPTVAHNRWIDR